MIPPIDGPAEVDCTLLPAAPSCAPSVEGCIDIGTGDGTGQTEWGFQVCTLNPPMPPLPATGISGMGVFVLGAIAWCVGWALVFLVRERRQDERNTPL